MLQQVAGLAAGHWNVNSKAVTVSDALCLITCLQFSMYPSAHIEAWIHGVLAKPVMGSACRPMDVCNPEFQKKTLKLAFMTPGVGLARSREIRPGF